MAFKMRSGYKPAFKQMGSSPNKRLPDLSIRNLTENPSDIYSGEVLGKEGWNQTPLDEANVDHLRRTNFEFDANTKKGRKERADHESFLDNRAKSTRRIDVKKSRDTGGSQLTKRQIKMGMSQVQDPEGNWHTISKRGKLVGSSTGYGDASKAWRQQYSLGGPTGEKTTTVDKVKPTSVSDKKEIKLQKPEKPSAPSGPTFDEAFAAARKGKKEVFEWKGKKTGGKTKKFHSRMKGESEGDWREKLGLDDIGGNKK